MATTLPSEGHCQLCNKVLELKRNGTVRHHLSPKTGSYKPPACNGAGRVPKESMPVSAELVGLVVRQVFRSFPGRCTPEVQTAIELALTRELGPRLRAVEGQQTALVDLASLGAALAFGEITDTRERDDASEVLSEEIAELRRRYPRLNPKEKP